jgi:hypothetical protein
LNERSNGRISLLQLKIQIKRILNIDVAASRIGYYRHNVIGTNYRRAHYKPKIYSEAEKTDRLLWALNMKENWAVNRWKLLCADETRIQTERGPLYINRTPTSRPKVAGVQPRANASLNVWAGINFQTCTRPAVFSENLNSDGYINIVNEILVPFISTRPANAQVILIQDNASVHKSAASVACLESNNVNSVRVRVRVRVKFF